MPALNWCGLAVFPYKMRPDPSITHRWFQRAGFWLSVTLLLLGTEPVSARSLDDIRASGTLRICVAGSSAALYQANGEAFAQSLQVRPEVRTLSSFDEQFQNAQGQTVEADAYDPRLLADGSCDLFPNDLHRVPWRLSKMSIVPYYTVRKVIVARPALQGKVQQAGDLAGLRAAVQKGTAYATWLDAQNREHNSERRIEMLYAPTEAAILMVAEGRADFTVLGTDGALKWVRSNPARLALLFPVDEPVAVGWGVSRAAPDLAAALARFFEDSARVGSALDQNWQRYYGISWSEYRLFQDSFETEGIDLQTLMAWAAPVASAVMALLILLLTWSLRSARRSQHAIESSRRNLESMVEAIVSTVESRDPYTAGHERRVAALARAIGTEMGLPAHTVEGIHFGALIHDLGKIRVPEELLCKPTRLSEAEMAVIKMHPEVGHAIVRDIQFPWPVAEMILQHHERLDGSGYPQGLRGEQLLLEARILAVADTVEAMASHRPYRPGLGIEAALDEIRKDSGRVYDPAAVQACLAVFERGFAFA